MTKDLLPYFKDRTQNIIDLLTEMVNYESFSTDKPAVDKLAVFMAEKCRAFGAESVEILPQVEVGDFVLAKWNSGAQGKPILILGHIDTVWKPGTLAERPVTITGDGILFGPGALDMKAGNTIALSAIHGLIERGEMPERPIWVLFNSDEEIGSHASTPIIESLAAQAGLVLIMEPGTPDGALKTQRKGIATYRLHITGRASHAGNFPEQGINAIIEAAQQAVSLNKLNDLRNGTSVSVTMIDGGSAGNVIPDRASIYIDTRTITIQAAQRIDKAIGDLQPQVPGAKIELERIHQRPPMEHNAVMQASFAQAKTIGAEYGLTIREESVGGGSDGNTTAAMGIPTLDGLGAIGDGLHALHEQLLISSLAERTTLCAAIIKEWAFSGN
ncbi:MAG: M20 family metallopeptidase [Aggregatilineales bacterium]